MPRTLDKQARKAQLAEAVWDVITDLGIAAVSVRSVADRAGVVVGSLRHVFPTRTDLVTFSAELMVQRVQQRLAATERTDDPRVDAVEQLRHLLPLTEQTRVEFEVTIALIAESVAEPALTEIRDVAHADLSRLCTELAERLTGRPRDEHTERAGRRLHALVDGLAMQLLHQADEVDGEWAVAMVREEVDNLYRTRELGEH